MDISEPDVTGYDPGGHRRRRSWHRHFRLARPRGWCHHRQLEECWRRVDDADGSLHKARRAGIRRRLPRLPDGQVRAVWSEHEGAADLHPRSRAQPWRRLVTTRGPHDRARWGDRTDRAGGPRRRPVRRLRGRASGSHSVIVSARTLGGAQWRQLGDIPVAGALGGGLDADVDPSGNVVMAWIVGAQDAPRWVQAAGLDAAGPVLRRFEAPATGMAGTPSTFSALAHDVWSPIASYEWTFGDGGTASGASVAHTYAAERRYTAWLTVMTVSGTSPRGQRASRSRSSPRCCSRPGSPGSTSVEDRSVRSDVRYRNGRSSRYGSPPRRPSRSSSGASTSIAATAAGAITVSS